PPEGLRPVDTRRRNGIIVYSILNFELYTLQEDFRRARPMTENTLTPVRRGGLVLETLEQLQRVILSGELPEGAPLREVPLAEKLGVSRVPVREALFELERRGLAVFEPSGRARVRTFTPRDVSEILSLRATLQVM